METTTLIVKGMTCMGCVASVKKVVCPIPGVNSVEITLENGHVIITHDQTKCAVDIIKNAINDAGYEVVD